MARKQIQNSKTIVTINMKGYNLWKLVAKGYASGRRLGNIVLDFYVMVSPHPLPSNI